MLPIPRAMLSVLLIGSIATGAYIVANQQSPKNNDETTTIENNVEESKEVKLDLEEEKKSEPATDAEEPASEDDGIEISDGDVRSGDTSLSIELITQAGNIGTRLNPGSTTQEPSETIPEVTNTVISAEDQEMKEIGQRDGSKNTKQIENAEADSDKKEKIETEESTSTLDKVKGALKSFWGWIRGNR